MKFICKSINMKKDSKIYWIVAIVLSFFRACGLHFYIGEVEKNLAISFQITIFLLRWACWFVMLFGVIMLFEYLMKKLETYSLENQNSTNSELLRMPISDKIKCYIPFAIGWFPLLVIKYPGAMCWDSWSMLHSYRIGKVTEHHSVFYSALCGKIVGIFENWGYLNWGLFLTAVLHYVFLVLAFGYSISIIKKMRAKRWFVNIIIGCYLVNPYISGYVGVIMKDPIYAAGILILLTNLIDMLIDFDSYIKNKKNWIILALAFGVVYLVRKNGSYTLVFLTISTFIYFYKTRKTKLPVVVMIISLVVAAFINTGLSKHYDATPGSTREALSLPFQQTARYIKQYENEITKNEKQIIDAVLEYDKIAEKYNPRISDPVKNTYKENDEGLRDYFKVWLKHLFRHPLCYIQATLEQNYYLFVPEVDNIVLYQDYVIGYEIGTKYDLSEKNFYEDIFESVGILSRLQKWVIKEFELLHAIPIIRCLGNISIWFYIMVFIISYCIKHKRQWSLPMIPMIVTLLFVILGPALQGHPRYMFPIIYSMPVYMVWIIYNARFEGKA